MAERFCIGAVWFICLNREFSGLKDGLGFLVVGSVGGMNPLRLALLVASPFCSAKRGGMVVPVLHEMRL